MNDSLGEVRRRDRSKSDAWIRSFLARAPFGFLATVFRGRPFINSNLFVYVEADHAIYMHSSRLGRTGSILRWSTAVTFSTAMVGRILPAPRARSFSVEYASVVVFGRVRLLTEEAEQRAALQHLLERYAPHLRSGRDYEPISDDDVHRTAVYRLDIEDWSGKENVADSDFPGAFEIPSPSIPLVP